METRGAIFIKYSRIMLAEQELRNLAATISNDFTVNVDNSQGALVEELKTAVNELNRFRAELYDVVNKTANALNNTIVTFKQTDEGISYNG